MSAQAEVRLVRGYSIVANGDEISQIDGSTFAVPSQSGNGSYQVSRLESGWSCSCPDHTYRKVDCKHIHAVKFWLQLRAKFTLKPRSEREVKECKWCGSPSFIKYGSEAGKQVYKCKDCGRKFVADNGFKGLKYDPKIISVTLDLYFKGSSLRKIADHLNQFYDLNIHYSTLYYWIKRYVKAIGDYVRTLVPETSGVLHADEMKVKVGGEWKWLWNVMDKDTRFLLASAISEQRGAEDARQVFEQAKNRMRDKPRVLVTDGLASYQTAFLREFWTLKGPRTRHIARPRFLDPVNNNLVERMQGTRRERDKVLRGMKINETPIREGFDIYYNFVRRHQSLNGRTPAQEANIDIDLDGNRWLGLLERAVRNNGS